jgi:hypothetical protein
LRRAAWSGAALVLLLPAVAMLFSREVAWGAGDFFAAAILLSALCLAIELATRHSTDGLYLAAFALGVTPAIALVWANLAVGVVGEPGNPANRLFIAAPIVAVAGAALARLRAHGMAWVSAATATTQAIVSLLAAGATTSAWPGLMFCAPWLLASVGFHRASRRSRGVSA